jgi:translation initiation factor eIF-2B subunit epsilon
MPLFGQILAALYQDDIVDEDDIRAWHKLSASKGEGRKPGSETDNFKKCWLIGSHMINQFDDQESDEDEDSNADTAGRTGKMVDSEDEESEQLSEEI